MVLTLQSLAKTEIQKDSLNAVYHNKSITTESRITNVDERKGKKRNLQQF